MNKNYRIEEIQTKPPTWYKTYWTYYQNIRHEVLPIDKTQHTNSTDLGSFWEIMPLLMPNHFESYAIVLHQHSDADTDRALPKTQRYSRQEIYAKLNIPYLSEDIYDLDSYALADSKLWKSELREELFTSLLQLNGDCHPKQYDFIVNIISTLELNTEVFYHYDLLKVLDNSIYQENDKMFFGELLQYSNLVKATNIACQPTAIFAKDSNWAMITDYDLPYTFIGGKLSLIKKLINTQYDIYGISPRFKIITH
ncbi:hypothetical protein SAMN05421749_1074 [Acinetobacter marinus]|uniref:Uncharacterized protein n=1 Tax=Acinetobacter marinus TaxID=281375 RepID=A0A1G6MI45_9GAMM|nr:hypothetical protein [Acinetobacter marinus]SDC54625.1 hypothetical protein SAMN05421749_1074 [Acinetobacter marinus]